MAGSWVRADLRGLQPIRQATSALCWLACFRMLYTWKGLDPSTIEGKLRGAGLDYDAACRTGLQPDDFSKAAKALGLTWSAFGQSISASDLQQRLANGPLWAAGEWFKFGLHARLVIGASDDLVEFFDPWWGPGYGGYDLDDLKHQDLIENFVHGDKKSATGTDKLIGRVQLIYWKAPPKVTKVGVDKSGGSGGGSGAGTGSGGSGSGSGAGTGSGGSGSGSGAGTGSGGSTPPTANG